ncbi:MAG: hypothetical protein ACE5GT_09870 [Rhodospirillales bacterium]
MSEPLAKNTERERTVFNKIISALDELDELAQAKILSTVQMFLGLGDQLQSKMTAPAASGTLELSGTRPHTKSSVPYSTEIEVSPKEFLREKQPQTDVERMACLAYYLTHYRDTLQFKTLDLSKLNTEAAQRKFANPSKTAANAVQYGYFAPAAKKGSRQLSSAGEEFVMALPDREMAKAAMARGRPKRKKKNA